MADRLMFINPISNMERELPAPSALECPMLFMDKREISFSLNYADTSSWSEFHRGTECFRLRHGFLSIRAVEFPAMVAEVHQYKDEDGLMMVKMKLIATTAPKRVWVWPDIKGWLRATFSRKERKENG